MYKWKITNLSISLILENKRAGEISSIYQTYREADITPKLINKTKELLLQKKIKRVEIDNTLEHIGMSIFVDGSKSQIGIVDETNEVIYYYSNGSQSQKNVDFDGFSFKEWMICEQPDTMLSILSEFINSGKRLEIVLWVSEEI